MKKCLVCISALIIVYMLLFPQRGNLAAYAGISLTLTPTADSYIDSSLASSNFGSANPLIASAAVRRALLKFNTALPPGSTVSSVSIRLYARSSPSSGGYEIHPEADSWTESTVTWTNQPAWNTAVLATGSKPVSGTWVTIPLPVNSVNTLGNSNFGIRFSVSGINAQFSSREDAINKPQLVIIYSGSPTVTVTPTATPAPSPTGTPTATPTPSATPTPTPAPGDIVIAAAGDIVDTCTGTGCEYYKVSDVILGIQPNTVLALGDLSNNSGSMNDYTGPFGNSWGRFKSLISPVPGNHDYGASGAANYYNYFGTAAHGLNGYYSFDTGSWHIVAINSNCAKVAGGCAAGSPQELWLKSDLAANTKPCTIAFWHHPRYSSGHDGDNTFMSDIFGDLYNANAEIVLSGHSHDYERFAPQNNTGQLDTARGITQFVVGTGGAFWTGFGSLHPNSQVHQNSAHGALKLTLHANSYDWKFTPEAGKTWTDSGSASCH